MDQSNKKARRKYFVESFMFSTAVIISKLASKQATTTTTTMMIIEGVVFVETIKIKWIDFSCFWHCVFPAIQFHISFTFINFSPFSLSLSHSHSLHGTVGCRNSCRKYM